MAKKEEHEPEQITAWNRVVISIINAVATTSNRMGMPTAIFILLLSAVYLFGDAKTKDEFIRTLLFDPPNGGNQPMIRWFFAILVGLMVATPLIIRLWGKMSEADENVRLRKRVSELEAKLLPANDEEPETEQRKRTKKKAALPEDVKPGASTGS